MNTGTNAPCVSHAVAIVELTRIARESGRCDDFVNLAQFCATEPVVAVLRHAAAMVRGTSAADEWLDYSATQIVPAVVRALGVCNVALFGVFDRDENRLIAAIAETEAKMEGYEDAALLAGEDVWRELAEWELLPECGGAWWCQAYADALAPKSSS